MEQSAMDALDIVTSGLRDIEDSIIINGSDKEQCDYAVHVSLLLLANKIQNYLKVDASDTFKERFLI